MKSPVLGLALSTVAFGAASIYLWIQLDAQRVQSEKFERMNAELNARLAELDQRRAEFSQHHRGAPPVFEQVVVNAPRSDALPSEAHDGRHPQDPTSSFRSPPEMPAAMRKMMRANMRAQGKRMYFDLQSKLGLSDEQTNALFDLIAEQQTEGFGHRRNQDPDDSGAGWEAQQARHKSEIADLLGSAKAVEFEEFQKTVPSRSELLMISQQLEGVEAPLNDDQRTRLLAALVEERERIPTPAPAEGTAQDEVIKAYNEWQSDYEKRVSDRARGILTAAQLDTYGDYQDWQRQMREQFAVQGTGWTPARGPRNGMFLAAPAGGVAFAVSTEASPPAPAKKP